MVNQIVTWLWRGFRAAQFRFALLFIPVRPSFWGSLFLSPIFQSNLKWSYVETRDKKNPLYKKNFGLTLGESSCFRTPNTGTVFCFRLSCCTPNGSSTCSPVSGTPRLHCFPEVHLSRRMWPTIPRLKWRSRVEWQKMPEELRLPLCLRVVFYFVFFASVGVIMVLHPVWIRVVPGLPNLFI